MNKVDAHELATRLGREHPDRAKYRWLAREQPGGEWTVVKVAIPSTGAVTPSVEARPKPPHDDSMPPWQSTGGLPPYIFGG
jgi:hypothetical protein